MDTTLMKLNYKLSEQLKSQKLKSWMRIKMHQRKNKKMIKRILRLYNPKAQPYSFGMFSNNLDITKLHQFRVFLK